MAEVTIPGWTCVSATMQAPTAPGQLCFVRHGCLVDGLDRLHHLLPGCLHVVLDRLHHQLPGCPHEPPVFLSCVPEDSGVMGRTNFALAH